MKVEVGAIVECKVTGVTGFGAFVDLGEGKTGMIHVSEVSQNYVKDIKEFVHEGDVVRAKVITIDQNGKISLSIKQLQAPAVREKRKQSYSKPVFNGRPEEIDWQAEKKTESLALEDMLSKFKQSSEEKMSDLKKIVESKRGKSYKKR